MDAEEGKNNDLIKCTVLFCLLLKYIFSFTVAILLFVIRQEYTDKAWNVQIMGVIGMGVCKCVILSHFITTYVGGIFSLMRTELYFSLRSCNL